MAHSSEDIPMKATLVFEPAPEQTVITLGLVATAEAVVIKAEQTEETP